jgi:hypothetical protein
MSNLISATYKSTSNFFQNVSISYENTTGKNLSSALKIASCFVLIASLYVGVKYVISLIGRVSQSDSSKPKDEPIEDTKGDISGKSSGGQMEEAPRNDVHWKRFIRLSSDPSNPKDQQIDDIGGDISGKSIGGLMEEVPKTSDSSLVVYAPQSNSSNSKNERIDDTRGDIFAESIDVQLQEFFKSSEKTQKLFVINKLKVGVIFNPRRERIEIGLFEVSEHVILASLKPVPKAVWDIIENKAPPNQTSANLHYDWGNGIIFRDLGFV